MKQAQDKLKKCISLYVVEKIVEGGELEVKILANKVDDKDKWNEINSAVFVTISKSKKINRVGQYGVCKRSLDQFNPISDKQHINAIPTEQYYPIELIPMKKANKLSQVLKMMKNGLPIKPYFNNFALYAGEIKEDMNDIECIYSSLDDYKGCSCDFRLKEEFKQFKLCRLSNVRIMKFSNNDKIKYFLGENIEENETECCNIDDYIKNDNPETLKTNVTNNEDLKTQVKKYSEVRIVESRKEGKVQHNTSDNIVSVDLNNEKLESKIIKKDQEDARSELNSDLDNIKKIIKERQNELQLIINEISAKTDCLKRVETELDETNTELDAKKTELDKISNEYIFTDDALKTTQKELLIKKQDIERQSDEKKRIEDEFAKKVEEKVHWAKGNIVEYLSNMSLSSLVPSIRADEPVKLLDEFDIHKSPQKQAKIEDVRDIQSDNLSKIGVVDEYLDTFSLWLLAAIQTRTPLLLAGPRAQNIADAVSMSLFARKAAVFHCEGEPTRDAIRQIEKAKSDVIAIHHALQCKWTDYLPEMLAIPNKHYFVIHPFVEDLQIEPKTLYSYMFPFFTEILIEYQIPNSNFDDFDAGYVLSEVLYKKNDAATEKNGSAAKCERVIRNLKLASKFVDAKMGKLCSEFYYLKKLVNENLDYHDNECLYCYLPYAYVTGQMDKLKEKLNGALKLSDKDKVNKLVNSYCGEKE